MNIYIIGNPLVHSDCLPLRILPMLKKIYPRIQFKEADPNENFIPEEGSIIIDTVKGIDTVTQFDSLDAFETTQSISPHDYDLGLHLRLLQKLHKIQSVRIIGVPQKGIIDKIIEDVTVYISM
jgi:Ni,Fe-hydrogenase maturation factor